MARSNLNIGRAATSWQPSTRHFHPHYLLPIDHRRPNPMNMAITFTTPSPLQSTLPPSTSVPTPILPVILTPSPISVHLPRQPPIPGINQNTPLGTPCTWPPRRWKRSRFSTGARKNLYVVLNNDSTNAWGKNPGTEPYPTRCLDTSSSSNHQLNGPR